MPIKNLASGTLAESVSASTTRLMVYVGEGSASTIRNVWPNTPFYATIMPANPSAGVANSLDSEIVKVTLVGNDQVGNVALAVERAQRGTTGKAFTAGAIVTNANYAEDAVLLGDEGTAETPSPWIKYDDIITNNTTDANGWTRLRLSEKATLYRRTFTFSNVSVPGGNGLGAVAVNINKPANVSFYESEVIGEAISCSTGEVFFHRIDDLSKTTCRLYAINSTATARTISGYYTLTCIKITT